MVTRTQVRMAVVGGPHGQEAGSAPSKPPSPDVQEIPLHPSAVLTLACVALVAVAVVPAAGQEASEDGYRTTTGRSEPVYEVGEPEPYTVETEYGTIYGEVIRPLVPEGHPVPVILTYSPYNILTSPTNHTGSIADDGVAEYFVPRGYARAVFDLVGTRESSGCYDYGGVAERETGAAVVDFLGGQPWSNGKVGMIGGSYDGTTAIAAAVEGPEHLAAIIPQVAIDRWYDYAFGAGIRYFLNSEFPADEGFDTPLAFDFGFGFLPPTDPTQPQFSDALADHIRPCERLLHTERAYELDPVYDGFWAERDYRRRAGNVRAAVFLEGGWLDHNVKHWDTTRFYLALPEDVPKKMAIGWWRHSASQFPDAQDLRHAWFDEFLLGLDTGVTDLPRVDTQLNTEERVQEPTWPPPGTQEVALPLSGEARPGALALDGGGAPTWQDVDPRLTEDEALAGACGPRCLVFLSSPLATQIRVSGGPVVDLVATTDDVSTHLTPVLFHEDPDGGRTILSRGFLNTRNRAGLGTSQPTTPGEPYRAPVPVWDIDVRVPAGHRLGIAVMSANAAWVLPEDDTRATTTLDLDRSHLRLPISEGAGALRAETRAVGPPTGGGDGGALPATGGGFVGAAVVALAASMRFRGRR